MSLWPADPTVRHERAASRGTARPDAVVLGSGVNLIEVVRSLSLAGVRSRVVPRPGEPAQYSRHATTIMVRDWADPDLDGSEEFVEKLVGYGRRQPVKLPLLFTSDEALLLVSAHRDRLATAFRFVIAPHRLVLDCADKGRFADLAERLGLPVPPTLVLTPRPGAPMPDVAELGLPLVVKPQRRDRAWHDVLGTRGKAIHVGSVEQLAALWPRLCQLGHTTLVQRAVPGREDRIESYHVYVDEQGRVAAEFTGRKIRTVPRQYGHTTALVITDIDDVLRSGREVVARLGLVGVAKLDYKRDLDGRLHLLEVNPRFHLWHHPAARAGINIPDMVHADVTGRPRATATEPPATMTWCHPTDWVAARADGLSSLQWTRWAVACPAKAFWAWDDPVPLLAACVQRAMR